MSKRSPHPEHVEPINKEYKKNLRNSMDSINQSS